MWELLDSEPADMPPKTKPNKKPSPKRQRTPPSRSSSSPASISLPPSIEVGANRRFSPSKLGQSIESGEWRPYRGRAAPFTVMSYNVLADYLMERHRHDLYRGQADDVLRWETRYPRLIGEILHRDPDVLCMQEVQNTHFRSHFQRDLGAAGYQGVYKKRTEEKKDGCAIFYKSDKVAALICVRLLEPESNYG